MKAFIEQIVAVFRAMPTSRKVTMSVVLAVVVSAFAVMFFWANQIDYQVLYSNLTQEDAGEIVSKLREQRIPYQLSGGGSVVSVPTEHVYEVRLSLAKEGLPAGGSVGFEIFDQTNFSTTEFVQRLNYQRALQGELVRTISDFREVENARVLLVLPKESLFVEDSKPPSASVLLKLRSPLPPDKVSGIVHLVASAVEGLSPEQVTVVDTSGRVLFKGPNQADEAALVSSNKLDYQRQTEAGIAEQIQSMLESIVGKGKAVVRVSADIDMDQVDVSEEKFDPDSSVVRSKQRRTESADRSKGNGSEVRLEDTNQGTIPVQGGADGRTSAQKEDEIVNFEINKITRHVSQSSGAIKRLSVAAAIDGTYEMAQAEDGTQTKRFVPRSKEELQEFEKIVKRAMGFDADRGDQVHISSFSLAVSEDLSFEEPGVDWLALSRQHSRTLINIALVLLVFMFVVRPLLKSVKTINTVRDGGLRELPAGEKGNELPAESLPEPPADVGMREKTMSIARQHPERTEQMVRGWLHGDQ
jgi:flagellar M-ring protein FliF